MINVIKQVPVRNMVNEYNRKEGACASFPFY